MSTIEDIVSCFILTQDVDKHAFKFTIQTSPGRVPMYICVVLPLALTLRNFLGHVPLPAQWRRRLCEQLQVFTEFAYDSLVILHLELFTS